MLTVEPTVSNVTDTTDSPLGAADVGMIFLMALVLLIIMASTSYDLVTQRVSSWKRKRVTGTAHDILVSFSLYNNTRQLLKTSSASGTMSCLHGLRFLSILWILLAHTCYMMSVIPRINNPDDKDFDQNVGMMLIFNASLATDTFLLLSGTLLAYGFMKLWDSELSFNIATFYIHRYLRLTPPYAFLIFFYATLFFRLGSGPLWNKWVGRNRDYCVANWWTNLLYINNYINVQEMCLDQTWYLAVDMQLLWFSPVLLYPLAKYPLFGKGLLAFFIIVSAVIPFAITYAEGLTALMIYTKEVSAVVAVYNLIYTRTYARAGPYLIGIAFGYLLYTFKNKHVTLRMFWVALGWLVSFCSCTATVFGGAVFYSDNHKYNAFESSTYAGLYRSVWALSVAWIAFACITGYGGPVDAFLSWKAFVPLSRLTYCTYLCQYVVLLINVGSSRVPTYLSVYTAIHEFAGNLLFILVLSVAISLAFEMPFINLDRILIKRHLHDHTNKAESTDPAAMAVPQSSILLDNGVHQENESSVTNMYVTSDRVQSKSYENKAFEMCQ